MKNLARILKKDCSNVFTSNLSDDDFMVVAKNLGYTREPDFFVGLLFQRLRQGYDNFAAFSKENQVKALAGLGLNIHREYEGFLYQALRSTLMERLEFGKHDHRFSCLDDLVMEIGLASEPLKTVHVLVDNLSQVYNLLNEISVQEGIRRFHRQNVQDQRFYLLKAASLL